MYYERHIFVCENVREAGPRESCGPKGSGELRDYLKSSVKKSCPGRRIRVNKAGCLDRCEEGPTVVVYPEGRWFRLESKADVDRFVAAYLKNDSVDGIEDLRLPDTHPSRRS